MAIIYDPGGNGFRIERLWASLTIHNDGDEGVSAFLGRDQTWMPMVCADDARVESLRPMAKQLATLTAKPIMLAKFEQRTDAGLIVP